MIEHKEIVNSFHMNIFDTFMFGERQENVIFTILDHVCLSALQQQTCTSSKFAMAPLQCLAGATLVAVGPNQPLHKSLWSSLPCSHNFAGR
jgi:hypothetical protein